jgi:hypothetical protein
VRNFLSPKHEKQQHFQRLLLTETSGSSGLGSHNNEQIDKSTLLIVSAGDHWSFKMSRQIDPLLRSQHVSTSHKNHSFQTIRTC